MQIYELTIVRKDKSEKIYYVVHQKRGIGFYVPREFGGLEDVTKTFGEGWDFSFPLGGSVKLRRLEPFRARNVAVQMSKKQRDKISR